MTLSQVLLWPFSFLYGLITSFRNHLFDIGYSRSFRFDTLVITVGNLSVGGTGKTPMIEYLVNLLKNRAVVVLSRGYKRKTSGFRIVTDSDNANLVGDEPYQIYSKFKNIATIAVGEDRAVAIPQILYEKEDTEIILLDDAFQHRSVIPNLSILLSQFDKPFYEDYVLPAGRLREYRTNANRADFVIITKCNDDLSEDNMEEIKRKVRKYAGIDKPVYFTSIEYDLPKPVYDFNQQPGENAIVFSGLANADLFEEYLSTKFTIVNHLGFSDHYDYTQKDAYEIISCYESIESDSKCIITTEKDMVKIISSEFKLLFQNLPVFFIPIKTRFLRDGAFFDEMVFKAISKSV